VSQLPAMTPDEWAGRESHERPAAMIALALACEAGDWDYTEQALSETHEPEKPLSPEQRAGIARHRELARTLRKAARMLREDAAEWGALFPSPATQEARDE
jgi:hypothetical protein